jgi:hypothetical protein
MNSVIMVRIALLIFFAVFAFSDHFFETFCSVFLDQSLCGFFHFFVIVPIGSGPSLKRGKIVRKKSFVG